MITGWYIKSKKIKKRTITQWMNYKGMNFLKKDNNIENIKYQSISKKLSKNQLYIDIASGSQNYYIFTLDRDNNITFEKLSMEDTNKINQNINSFRDNNQKMATAIQQKTLSHKLQTRLKVVAIEKLTNIKKIILDKYLSNQIKDKKELIISPDGLLNFLPFEALYHNGKYLIEDYKISYISSGREFVRQTKREKANPKYEMICFGNPDFNASLPIGDTKDMPNLTPLDKWEYYQNFKHIGDAEINITRDMYPNALIYEKKDATIKNLMKIESPRILHFSTHGNFLINDKIKNPMLKAGLAFTGANKKLDGIATALKLSALDLKDTELVLLSACESGLGEVQNAEGVMGLPKAFLQAGARDVIMSLWSVSTKKTATLMEDFYKNLKKNQDYSTALRNAKLEMIKKDMHPYYWSAFIIHGI